MSAFGRNNPTLQRIPTAELEPYEFEKVLDEIKFFNGERNNVYEVTNIAGAVKLLQEKDELFQNPICKRVIKQITPNLVSHSL